MSIDEALRRAIARKRENRELDSLITDELLRRALRAEPAAWISEGTITLPACLASELPDVWPPMPTIRALNDNLQELREGGAIRKPGQLAKKLLNREQFFNTISELALARTVKDQGWSVRLEEPFFGGKDVDILASREGDDIYIEVTNLASNELGEGVQGGEVTRISERDLAVRKIITKYREKFEVAIERGWPGHPWLALNVAMNDGKNIEYELQSILRVGTFATELAEHVGSECPRLSGLILYRHPAPTCTHVTIDAWYPVREAVS